jgi:hypothetical protein
MEKKSSLKLFFLGLSIFAGLSILGLFIFKGLKTFSDKDRVVTVKGLAEMNMNAVSASITMSYSFSGDDLNTLIKQNKDKISAIVSYLSKNGYDDNDFKINNLNVSDKQKYYELQWLGDRQVEVKIDRYAITQSLTIESKDVKATGDRASQMELDLISKDLTSTIATNYVFPELNTIKPKLIAESTRNARIAGEQFANDSQAKLGKIKTASQGQISIAGQYYYEEDTPSEKPKEPYIQRARVVSTIVFFLE